MTTFKSVVSDLINKKRKLGCDNLDHPTPSKLPKVEANTNDKVSDDKISDDQVSLRAKQAKQSAVQETNQAKQSARQETKQEETNQAKQSESQPKSINTQDKEHPPKEDHHNEKHVAEAKVGSMQKTFEQVERTLSDQVPSREYSCECIKFFVVRVNQLLSILSQIVASQSYANKFKVGLARTKFNTEFHGVPETVKAVWNMSDHQKQRARGYMSIWYKAASTKVGELASTVHGVLSDEAFPPLDAVNTIVAHIPVLKTVGLDEMARSFEVNNLTVIRKLLISLCHLVL
jgi:hypothetical protein